MNIYKTHEVAKKIGIHVNTVRLYEESGFIKKPERLANGYRVFTDLHIEQLRLARAALKVEVLQNGLRKKAINIIKATAAEQYDEARQLTQDYIKQIDQEISHGEEAIQICKQIMQDEEIVQVQDGLTLTRKETADLLQVTIDTLRNWEMNGLIHVKRKENRYRVYTLEDIQRLKLIRSLRCANYSLSAILRMLNALSKDSSIDIREAIDTPEESDDIITACDKLLTSLEEAKENAYYILKQLDKIITLH